MVNISIDVTDLGGEARPGDKVVFWRPRMGGSATHAGRVISTAPVTVFLTDGKATVSDVEPGEMTVLLQCRGVESQGPVTVGVPDGDHTVTLRALLESQFEYAPPIVSAVQEAASNASASEEAAIRAQIRSEAAADRADAKVDAAINNGAELVRDKVKQDADRAVSARQAATQSESNAAASEGAAASSASNAAASETNAKQSEDNAGDYAAVATTAATEAVDAMERATDLAGGDFATHEYVDEGLGLKAEQKDLESIRGRVNNIEPANANQSGSTVWAHATERGHRLPLGYDENGELDSHAKDAFSKSLNLEDKADKEDVEFALSQKQDSIDVDNPDYRWAMINVRSQLLMGIRNDGALIAPKHRLSPPSEYAKNDKGEWVPVFADTSQLTIWGSSTPAGLGSYIADAFADAPVAVNNMAQAGEWAQHSAARMGAIRGVVEPVTIPESGSVPLTFVDFAPRTADYAMRPFTATIAGVRGLVDTTGNDTKFVREEPGDAVTLTEQTEVIPIDGPQTREHVTLFGVGKNNLTQRYHVDLVNEYVDTMVDYLTPKYPRFLILGHHHNTGLAGDDNFARPHVDQVNAYNRDTYGPLFFDTIEVYSDLDRWAEAGITPTQADLDDLALGNKPPSLAHDTSHFNADGYRILATAIREHMAELGWY